MHMRELSEFLLQECYQPNVYHIGPGWESCGDTFCIDRVGIHFEVFYVERGQRGNVIRRCETEVAACAAFLEIIDREPFSRAHCIGFFTVQPEADALAQRLISAGIKVHRDAISYSSSTDMRYRVFVFGRDKLRAQELLRQE